MSKTIFTPKEAAKSLGVGMNTMYNLCSRADFPAVRLSARKIIIPIDGLQKWMSQQLDNKPFER